MSRFGFSVVILVLFNALLVGVLAMGVMWRHWLVPRLARRQSRRAIEHIIAQSEVERRSLRPSGTPVAHR